MRIAVGADERTSVVDAIVSELEARGHVVARFGRAADEVEVWGPTAVRVAKAVASGEAERGVVCCWTGTGVSIAANKIAGIRAALCVDAETARGARRWNDANVLALSLRLSSEAVAKEILAAFFEEAYGRTEDESLAAIAAAETTP